MIQNRKPHRRNHRTIRRGLCALAVLLSVTQVLASTGWTMSGDRLSSAVDPAELFGAQVRAAHDGDYETTRNLLQILEPRAEELRARFGVDAARILHRALASQEPGRRGRVECAAHLFVILSVRDRLRRDPAAGAAEDAGKTAIRQALVEFLIIEPAAQTNDFAAWQSIRNGLRAAYQLAGVPGQEERIADQVHEVERALARAFPRETGTALLDLLETCHDHAGSSRDNAIQDVDRLTEELAILDFLAPCAGPTGAAEVRQVVESLTVAALDPAAEPEALQEQARRAGRRLQDLCPGIFSLEAGE